jgi:hypothetical protein
MTKQQLKEKYIQWNIEISNTRERNTEIFHEMQQIARDNNLVVYCSMEMLLGELIQHNIKVDRVLQLYALYYRNEGKQQALHDLAIATDNFKIN